MAPDMGVSAGRSGWGTGFRRLAAILLALSVYGAGCHGSRAGEVPVTIPLPPGYTNFDPSAGQAWATPSPDAELLPMDEARRGYALEVEGNRFGAMQAYWQVYRRWPDSEGTGIALQRLAKCLFDENLLVRSALTVEIVLREYPASATATGLFNIELNIAHQLMSLAFEDPAANPNAPRDPGQVTLMLRQAQWLYRLLYTRGDAGITPELARESGLGMGLSCLYLGETDEAEAALYSVAEEFRATPAAGKAARLFAIARSVAAQQADGTRLDPRAIAALAVGALE